MVFHFISNTINKLIIAVLIFTALLYIYTKPTLHKTTMSLYPGLRIPARTAQTATVIFLHGLGDSPEGWAFLAQEAARQRRLQHVKFVFAKAPDQPVTLNYGMEMPSWYDIKALGNVMGLQDEEGILASVDRVKQIIKEELDEGVVDTPRIVIGGFSQGCAVSLATSVVYDKPLGGIIGLSGYLPIHERLEALKSDANVNTPYFLGHGTADQVVKFEFGKMSRDYLINNFGRTKVEWHQYENMVHTASPQEIEDLFQFLEKVIP